MAKTQVLEPMQLLYRQGRFAQALSAVNRSTTGNGVPRELFKAELLERLAEHEGARAILHKLERHALNQSDKAMCEYIAGQLASTSCDGGIHKAQAHFQKAISLAERAGDLPRLCWSQLRLVAILADTAGFDATTSLISQLRRNAIRLGDPHILAALHIFIAQIDGKQGLRASSEQHIRTGLRILDTDENIWLRSVAQNARTANLFVASDFAEALRAAKEGLVLAEESGAKLVVQALLANLGALHYVAGHFDQAVESVNRALEIAPWSSERAAGWGTLAAVFLTTGDLPKARTYIDQIESAIATGSESVRYQNRHAKVISAELCVREGHQGDALTAAESALVLARDSNDEFLRSLALLARANALLHAGRFGEFSLALADVARILPTRFPEVVAGFHRLLAIGLTGMGRHGASERHHVLGRRIYSGLRSVPGAIELDRMWSEACAKTPSAIQDRDEHLPRDIAASTLQNCATLMIHAGRPELLATGLVAILSEIDSVVCATAVSQAENGATEVLASYQAAERRLPAGPARTFALGTARNRKVEVIVEPYDDLEAFANLTAITMILDTVRDLERAHAEREEQLALWPVEDHVAPDGDAVVSGKMAELMAFARRVAVTNVSVLITGESGTGKEILARAIHSYSPRAAKPFIPFNCTAVPREMLESQLFGHRRGAFTSADRDSPGLIRAARDGTLFLDEIGELGLDLQPKLLRFLESGEICPLGESAPLHVDVRVVAATNRNLDDLVEQGKFREDLFYRLNVIRLTIPPLRERRDEIPPLVYHFVMRIASDFGKGRIRVAEETMEHLLLYPWPGNVRQLHNEVRRMIALVEPDSLLEPKALSHEIRRATTRHAPASNDMQLAIALDEKLMPTLTRIEQEMVRSALRAHKGRLEDAARALGISRKGLYLKRQRLGL